MSLLDLRSRFAYNPTPIYLVTITILALFALQSSPAFMPLVLLLAILRLFVVHVIIRENTLFNIALIIICLAGSTTIANIGPSLNATPFVRPAVAVASLFLLTCLTSALIVGAVLLDTTFKPSIHRIWAHFLLFPTIWATVLQLAAIISPLGYLATWTPVLSVGAYKWLRPFFGSAGIDWAVGAWAVVLSELIGMWIMGSGATLSFSGHRENLLVSVDDNEVLDDLESEKPRRSTRLFFIFAVLCIGALPSYFVRSLPLPVNSDMTIGVPVGCALPIADDPLVKPTLDEYKKETQRLYGLVKVILWPEGAVRFQSEEEKMKTIDFIGSLDHKSLVGISFEEYTNETGHEGKIRNGFMLVDHEGLIFEYFKRHLVPFVESESMTAYDESPPIYPYEFTIRESSRGKVKESRNLPITASICLDFAHPNIFSNIDLRPSLILAPASTWHESIGVAMWQQATARAEEVGSALMFCDGGAKGISGIAGQGMSSGEIVQVGRGSWARTIGFRREENTKKTLYGVTGPWLSIVLIWCVLGAERVVELVVARIRGNRSVEMNAIFGFRFVREAIGRFQEYRRERQGSEQNERAPLI